MLRSIKKLSSVSGLVLALTMLPPTTSQADVHPLGSGSGAMKCAALYWMATGAYPNDEGRRQELVKLQNFYARIFIKSHRVRGDITKGIRPYDVRITNRHIYEDKSNAVMGIGHRYAEDPNSIATLLRGCRRWHRKLTIPAENEFYKSGNEANALWMQEKMGPRPPKYNESDHYKAKRIVDRWFKAWTKMGRPTPQSMREDFKKKLRGN